MPLVELMFITYPLIAARICGSTDKGRKWFLSHWKLVNMMVYDLRFYDLKQISSCKKESDGNWYSNQKLWISNEILNSVSRLNVNNRRCKHCLLFLQHVYSTAYCATRWSKYFFNWYHEFTWLIDQRVSHTVPACSIRTTPHTFTSKTACKANTYRTGVEHTDLDKMWTVTVAKEINFLWNR